MYKAMVIFVLFLFSSSVFAEEIITILEWQGAVDPGNMDDHKKYCNNFPGNESDIIKFFQLSTQTKTPIKSNSFCYVTGVARNKDAQIIDWRLNLGGTGHIVNNKFTSYFSCKAESPCCKSLPQICHAQP